jgi:hypothetical protein
VDDRRCAVSEEGREADAAANDNDDDIDAAAVNHRGGHDSRGRALAAGLTLCLVAAAELGAAPSPPILNAPQVAGSSVALSWVAPAGAVNYRLEVGSAPGASNLASLLVGNTTTMTATNVAAGTYFVRVRAVGVDGESATSNEITVVVGSSVPCAEPPNQPQLFPAIVSGHAVTLSWRASTTGCSATTFQLQAGTAPGASNVAIVNANSALSLSAVAPAGIYFVRVVAQNSFGTSAASNEMTVIVGQVPPPATAPETFIGSIGPADTTCSTPVGERPCRIISFTPTASGLIDALLAWSSAGTDIDLFLYRDNSRIASSFASSGFHERVFEAIEAGRAYELRIVYFSGSTVQNYTLALSRQPSAVPGIWTRSGAETAVFEIPSDVLAVRITAAWNRSGSSSLVVRVGGQLVTSEQLQNSLTYERTHAIGAGSRLVEVSTAGNVAWSLTQVQ